jgi:hypothetical protein
MRMFFLNPFLNPLSKSKSLLIGHGAKALQIYFYLISILLAVKLMNSKKGLDISF